MNNPAKLRFHAWRKREEVFALHGWRAHEGLAFVEGLKGQQLVLRFMPLTDSGAVETWRPPLLPEVFPIKIEEIRLVHPPCRANEAEAELLRKESVTKKVPKNIQPLLSFGRLRPPAWELARLRCDPEILIPQSDDDGPMAIRLDEFKKEMQREFEARTQEVATLMRLLDEGQSIIGVAHYYPDLTDWPLKNLSMKRATCRFFLDKERLRLRDFISNCAKWTLDDARQCPRVRNPILRARWAKQNKRDFQQMADERKELLDWLRLPAPSPQKLPPTLSFLSNQQPKDFPSDEFTDSLSDFEAASEDEILVAASASYCVTFAKGQRAWFMDVQSRAPQNQSERQEFIQDQGAVIRHTKRRARTTERRDKPNRCAHFENNFSLAVIPQRKGEPLRLTVELELRSLVKRIIEAGGSIPRTELRKETDTFQPEKLLRSKTAKAIVKAGLLGSQRTGRTTVFWAKVRAD